MFKTGNTVSSRKRHVVLVALRATHVRRARGGRRGGLRLPLLLPLHQLHKSHTVGADRRISSQSTIAESPLALAALQFTPHCYTQRMSRTDRISQPQFVLYSF